jgi:hypothetical protein
MNRIRLEHWTTCCQDMTVIDSGSEQPCTNQLIGDWQPLATLNPISWLPGCTKCQPYASIVFCLLDVVLTIRSIPACSKASDEEPRSTCHGFEVSCDGLGSSAYLEHRTKLGLDFGLTPPPTSVSSTPDLLPRGKRRHEPPSHHVQSLLRSIRLQLVSRGRDVAGDSEALHLV